MELRLLRYFVAVAEESHVGRAAERLHMAQQPLSAAIKRLEADLGVALFERAGNRIRSTPAGIVFLDEARAVLARAELAAQRARDASLGVSGPLRIGYCAAAMERALPHVVGVFRDERPEVRLDLRMLEQDVQIAGLERGALDMAFIYHPFDTRGFASIDVLEEEYVVLLHAGHRLAANGIVATDDLADEPMVALADADYASFRASLRTLFANGRAPEVVREVRDKTTLAGLVAARTGFTILGEGSARGQMRPDIVVRKIDSPLRMRMALVWKADAANLPLLERVSQTLAGAKPLAPVYAIS